MNSYLWGPLAWHFLHTTTLAAPDEILDKKPYIEQFNALKQIIPCRLCRTHYRDHLKKMPIEDHCSSKKELTLWLINLHNVVNQSLNKPTIPANKCIKLYVVDGKLQTNHKSCFMFLDILAKTAKKVKSRNKIEGYKKFFGALDKTFPNLACRKRFRVAKKGLKDVDSSDSFKRWYNSVKGELQGGSLYKGCPQLVKCQLKNPSKSISYNLELNKGKQFVIRPNIELAKLLLKIEYVNKGETTDVYGHFELNDGTKCKRRLISDLETGYVLDKIKLTDTVQLDQEIRRKKLVGKKLEQAYLDSRLPV